MATTYTKSRGSATLRKMALAALMFLGMSNLSSAQNILFVNDNDNIVYNTDTIRSAMSNSMYSSYTYWSIPDSAGTGPSGAYMSTFDLVVWYCSTDGVGLKFWDGSTAANTDIIDYVTGGKPMWVIGQDLLYQEYATPSTFSTGEFASDYMGLSSYDVQSHVDDGGLGCPEADRVSTASTLFPATLKWGAATSPLWYADGCTPATGTLSIYQMGPASYTFNGRKCMFHSHTAGHNVMSTFFDPALIDSFNHRISFMQNGITYLLGTSTGVKNIVKNNSFVLYPNPVTTAVTIAAKMDKATAATVEFYNELGSRVKQQEVQMAAGKNVLSVPVEELNAGVFFVRVVDATGNALFTTRLIKQ